MSIVFRRFSAALIAVSLLGVATTEEAAAQRSNVGPAGGVSSTTAPSNGEGTPSGGTGVVGTTRVGPSSIAPAASPGYVAPTTEAAPQRRRRVRRAVRRTTRPAVQPATTN